MAKDDKYFLTDADRELLKQVIDREKVRQLNTRNRPMVPEEQSTAPEVYVALTPTDGIPALTDLDPVGTGTGTGFGPADNVPGVAMCLIYRIIRSYPGPTPYLQLVSRVPLPVYNIATSLIPGKKYVTINRDKFGDWFVQSAQSTSIQLWAQLAQTTIALGFASGSRTVTPDSMFGIIVDSVLLIDSNPNQETVTVTAVTGTTFTATFTLSHGTNCAVTFTNSESNTFALSPPFGSDGSYPGDLWTYDTVLKIWSSVSQKVWLLPQTPYLNQNVGFVEPNELYMASLAGVATDGRPEYVITVVPAHVALLNVSSSSPDANGLYTANIGDFNTGTLLGNFGAAYAYVKEPNSNKLIAGQKVLARYNRTIGRSPIGGVSYFGNPLYIAQEVTSVAIYQQANVQVGQEPILDFLNTGTVTFSLTDDPANKRVKVVGGLAPLSSVSVTLVTNVCPTVIGGQPSFEVERRTVTFPANSGITIGGRDCTVDPSCCSLEAIMMLGLGAGTGTGAGVGTGTGTGTTSPPSVSVERRTITFPMGATIGTADCTPILGCCGVCSNICLNGLPFVLTFTFPGSTTTCRSPVTLIWNNTSQEWEADPSQYPLGTWCVPRVFCGGGTLHMQIGAGFFDFTIISCDPFVATCSVDNNPNCACPSGVTGTLTG